MKYLLVSAAAVMAITGAAAIGNAQMQDKGPAPGASGSGDRGSGGGGERSQGAGGQQQERGKGADAGPGKGDSKAAQQSGDDKRKGAQSDRKSAGDKDQKRAGDQRQGDDKKAADRKGDRDDKKAADRKGDQDDKKAADRKGDQDDKKAADRKGDRDDKKAADRKGDQDDKKAADRKGDRDDKKAADRKGDRDDKKAADGKGDGDRDRQKSAGDQKRGDRVQISDRERTTVRQQLVRGRNVDRINRSRLNIDIRVGVHIPRSIRVYSLPTTLISTVPAYRGYSYIVLEDETICIVDPQTYVIVDVIPAGSLQADRGTRAHLTLSQDDMRFIYRSVPKHRRADVRVRLALGAEVPREVELYEFPAEVVERVPDVRRYRYVIVEDEIVVVDPNDYQVSLVIND